MSLGYLGYAQLVVEDDDYAIYEYSGENWNDGKSKSGDALLFDGEFQIRKSSLVEPEIHEKLKKTPTHKKKMVVKRIIQPVNLSRRFQDGDVAILRKCKNEFSRGELDSYLATLLIMKTFDEYQLNGKLPKSVGFMK